MDARILGRAKRSRPVKIYKARSRNVFRES